MARSTDVTVRRTGRAPLRLHGYGLIAQATSRAESGHRQTRWHEIEVWADDQRPAGPEQSHCVVIRYRTDWQGELGHDEAEVVARAGVAATLEVYDPLARLIGYPDRPDMAARQERLRADLRAGWKHAVSDVLDACGAAG